MKDWVTQLLHIQSGMDQTNDVISSYTSPVCVEGRDPYLSLLQLNVVSGDSQVPQVQARPSPNGRWYANVPLSAYVNAQTVLQAAYQNGAFTETKTLQWTPMNLLTNGDLTIRRGDALLLNALPPGGLNGKLQITVGTNQLNGRTTQPIVYRFTNDGVYTVTGTYTPAQGAPQSRSITVTAVGPTFTNNPDCWVGMERQWNLQSLATQAVLEADSRLLFEQTGTLPGNGRQMNLFIDQNEPRFILSRLGTNGPVLDSAGPLALICGPRRTRTCDSSRRIWMAANWSRCSWCSTRCCRMSRWNWIRLSAASHSTMDDGQDADRRRF